MFARAVAASILFFGMADAAIASGEQYLYQTSGTENLLTLGIAGDLTQLSIVQEFIGGGDGNTMAVSITGNSNGGPQGASFTGVAAQTGLTPGSLYQSGYGNSMNIDVNGTGNLFAFAQVGSHNALTAEIVGSYNQAAVYQSGAGNVVNFSQHGNGNVISVVQTSW
jgi:hypothetical protein